MPVDTNFDRLQARIDALRMRRSHVAALTDLSAGYLSQAASGQTDLAYPDFRAVERLLDTCEALQTRAGSIPIDWRNATAVKELIRDFENELKEPPAPLTGEDWELLGATTPEAMTALAEKRGLTVQQLLATIESSLPKFDYQIRQMQKSSSEMRDLTRLTREEFEVRKSSRK
jgi:transcriptional regulator with XRE-family HTH domain